MADKGTKMPEGAGDFTEGGPASVDPEAQRLAEAHRAENLKKQAAAERKSNVSDDLYKRHKKTIGSKRTELAKAQEIVNSLNGELRELYATAKDDGINIKALKEFFKLEEADPDELQETHRDIGRIIRVTKSKLGQLGLFDEAIDDGKGDIAPRARGFAAGKAGAGKDTNPFTPGTEDYVQHDEGWDEGQAAIVKGMGKGKNKLN